MNLSFLIIPLLVAVTSQALKLATDGIRGNFDVRHLLISYGGMPSAHTAFAVSITTLLGLRQGFDSPIFALAFVFTLLVMRDATSFRNILGQQARIFNRFIDHLPAHDKKDVPHFQERIGHSYAEVAAGALLGIVLTYCLALL